MALIAILPTGDWATVESDNDVQFIELTDVQLEVLNTWDFSENTILGLTDALDLDEYLNVNKAND